MTKKLSKFRFWVSYKINLKSGQYLLQMAQMFLLFGDSEELIFYQFWIFFMAPANNFWQNLSFFHVFI